MRRSGEQDASFKKLLGRCVTSVVREVSAGDQKLNLEQMAVIKNMPFTLSPRGLWCY